ncbi:MAG: bifunctional enoyl-CoA hydratase/phosphate acetyltransferase [Leptospiraceae bacterium]|nr:bifunctional enoyl-CoA hydratase/phosphate acetyltransferase [Leptospiraceae bacterium]
MITNFNEVKKRIQDYPVQKIAVASGTDSETLRAVAMARDESIAESVLVGDEKVIRENAEKENIDLQSIEIIHVEEPVKAGLKAVELVSSGKAGIFMKGYIHSDDFLRCVLDRDVGLRSENLLNHVFILDAQHLNRLLFITDGAMNISPSLEEKARIIANTIALAQVFEIERPKVAIVSAVEVVTPKIVSTLEAAALSKMSDRNQFHGGIVDGPLALDNAINPEAARYKKIGGEVAGQADILLMPEIVAANSLAKSFAHITGGTTAGLIFGAKAPVVLPSRSDSKESKLMGIACAVYVAGVNSVKRVKIGKVHF